MCNYFNNCRKTDLIKKVFKILAIAKTVCLPWLSVAVHFRKHDTTRNFTYFLSQICSFYHFMCTTERLTKEKLPWYTYNKS